MHVNKLKQGTMMKSIHPKLPMRNQQRTRDYYVNTLDFTVTGAYDDYLIVAKDGIELHFFEFRKLDPLQNYGQVYIRTNDIEALYRSFLDAGVPIHPNGPLQTKPWGQKEFSLLDPDYNLLTFGQGA